MEWLKNVKKWPIEKKRKFSILTAIFLTFLILILNFAVDKLWSNEANISSSQYWPTYQIKESFSKFYNEFQDIAKQFSSGTKEIIDQINTASSSFSTTTNIVE